MALLVYRELICLSQTWILSLLSYCSALPRSPFLRCCWGSRAYAPPGHGWRARGKTGDGAWTIAFNRAILWQIRPQTHPAPKSVCKPKNFGVQHVPFQRFSPLPYMAGQRYIVPGFNRLAAAALLTGFILTLMLLNYFGGRQKTSASFLIVIWHHLRAKK